MIAVTGATGFIGSHLLAYLLLDGSNVIGVCRNKESIKKAEEVLNLYNIDEGVIQSQLEWVEADVRDVFALSEIFSEVDYVYNCAGMVSFHPKDRDALISTNVKGTASVVDAAMASCVRKVCHVSSIAALGELPDGELHDEDVMWNGEKNRSFYSLTKHSAENEMWRGVAENLSTVIISPSVVLGEIPGERAGAGLFTSIKNGLSFYTVGATGFVDVRDVCKAMLRAMQSDLTDEKLIVSAGNYSYQDVLSRIARSYGIKKKLRKASPFLLSVFWRLTHLYSFFSRTSPLITKETARSANSVSFYNNAKSIEILGFKYTALDDTIKRLTKYYK